MARWFLVFLCCFCAFPEELLPEALHFEKARTRAAENLARLPNYTCLQTIERTTRRAPGRKLELVDMVRLEVALVNGKELFSWPGAGKFSDAEIGDLVTGGAIGNGEFAQFARAVFLTREPTFEFKGEQMHDNRRALRWDFDVPQFRSGYTLRARPHEAIVGYHGSFWVDPKSYDLLRLEIQADNVPPKLKISAAGSAIDYGRVRIGDADFLLPLRSELRITDVGGTENRNRTRFTGCRQYLGESKLSFADPESTTTEPKRIVELDLPAKLDIDSTLETPIALGRTAVGDPVTAVVRRNVKRSGTIVIPKGALIHGRVTLLREQNIGYEGYVVGLHYFAIEWPGHKGRIALDLERVPAIFDRPARGASFSGSRSDRQLQRALLHIDVPGSVFFVKGKFELKRGLLMQWRTRPLSETNTQ